MIDFCLELGVKRLTVLSFLARGRGLERSDDLQLSTSQRSMLHNQVKQERKSLGNRLDLRWLEIPASPLYVVEVDGRVVLEKGSEVLDQVICTIDHPPSGEYSNGVEKAGEDAGVRTG
jgi:hypothetical protein